MENALLYTFTTIAQALGGTFALLAAFVLYRFQTLNGLMTLDAGELQFGVDDETKKSLHTQLTNEARFLEMIRNVRMADLETTAKIAFERLQQNAAKRSTIGFYFVLSGLLTGLMMIASVVSIGIAQFLKMHETAAWSSLVAAWVGFSGCIVLYGVVILKSIRR